MVKININEHVRQYFDDHHVSFGGQLVDGFQIISADNVQIETDTGFWFGAATKLLTNIGCHSYTNSELSLTSKIGRYSSVGPHVQIMGSQHAVNRFSVSPLTYWDVKPEYGKDSENQFNPVPFNDLGGDDKRKVTIGNDVWVGQDVLFKAGVTVGDGAIIGARAVVTKNVPPYAIIGGVPAKVIRYRYPRYIIDKLLELQWWNYSIRDFKGIYGDDLIDNFIDKLATLIRNGEIEEFHPTVITASDLDELN
ncbi:CatB-related O-acetyltransferase [Levilactobacillus bambusae]|uniref:Acetyltransferase n=1 Tax=Levilactobacillus bambusae TaxID=2024736 RepID=A0A2V1MZX8_9LACO|nr:CatB-related O-acetyltransferase [Levilactobacillus bambusae]PWG00323.1 acetyltransferase [Levilactobacillus bambusae]